MNAIHISSLSLAVILSLSTGLANAGEAIAKKSGCMACHAVDKVLVGPSYKSVATKFRGDAHAIDELAKSVREGSKGVWGSIAMPPQPRISHADLKAVLTWILAQ